MAKPMATAPQASPPMVDFQALTDRENAERGEDISVFLFISNKSSMTLSNLKFNCADTDFEVTRNPAFSSPLPPFASFDEKAIIKASNNAGYSAHKLLLTVEYTWKSDKTEFVSKQQTIASVLVRRRFEEETKGFPGGTAAFFYLLLPIIPAILSFQFFEGLRKGQGAKMPTFSADYIVPAFFLAVILSLVMLLAFQRGGGLDYSNPVTFLKVLFTSLALGAIWPIAHGIYNLYQKRTWGFNNADTPQTYLRKALLAPWAPRKFRWSTGTVDEQRWQGILLRQPNGATLLGVRLQVSFPQQVTNERWNQFLQAVINENGSIVDRRRLVEMVEAGELQLDFLRRIRSGEPGHEQDEDEVVVIEEVKNWKRASDEASPLVTPFR